MRADSAAQSMSLTETGRSEDRSARRSGIAYALVSYLWFSSSLFWFKAVAHVPEWEVLAHRIIWSAVLLVVIVIATGRLRTALRVLRNRTAIATLAVTSLLIGCSWYTFIWAVTHDRILETSLAYYICPLIKVLLGCLCLREKLSPAQIASVVLAFIGMVILGVSYGHFPAISVTLAVVAGFYGLFRKRLPVDATTGLTFELLFLTPAAVIFVSQMLSRQQLVFTHATLTTDLLLIAAGVITTVPLLLYCHALKRLPYSTIGFIMYIMPSLTFLIAVWVFKEPLGLARLVTFGCVWVALLIYTYDEIRHSRTGKPPGLPG